MRIKNRSLKTKIFMAIALTFLLLGAAIYTFIYISFPQKYMENKKENVKGQVEKSLEKIESADDIYEETKAELLLISQRESVSIDVFANDVLLFSISSDRSYSIEDTHDDVMVDVVVGRDEEEYEEISIKHILAENAEIAANIYVPVKIIDDVAGVLLSSYPVIMIITVFMIAILSLIATWQISHPIVRIIEKVNAMSIFRHTPKKQQSGDNIRDELKLLDRKLENMYYMLYEGQINMERELKNQMKQEKLKFDFLRMAAHELKTPLTSINGMLEGMYYNIAPYSDREKYLLECQHIINDMNKLIMEMLISTELNSKSREETIYIKETLEKIADMFAVEQIKRNVELHMSIQADYEYYTNREILESALKNIVHNAVIYSKEHGIIDISLKDDALHIFNSCTSLAEDETEKIFEAFYRGDNDNANENGNGLGLYLVKRFFGVLGIEFEFKRAVVNGCEGMDFIIYLKKQ